MTHYRNSKVDQVEAFFMARPNAWVDSTELEFAGRCAWRTRVSDARRRGMNIVNRMRKVDGFILSEYRYVPTAA